MYFFSLEFVSLNSCALRDKVKCNSVCMLCINVYCLDRLSKSYQGIPVFLRSSVKPEQGWIWLVFSPRLENTGSSGGNTASHKFL